MNNNIVYQIPFLFDSEGLATDDGSTFQVNLDYTLMIPEHAKQCWITVPTATIWWTVFNITADNNILRVDDGLGGGLQALTISPGLYDLNKLSSEIGRQLAGAPTPINQNAFVLVPNQASQKVVIQANQAGLTIDFTGANTFRDILGFGAVVIGPTAGVEFFQAPNVAQFNQLDYFLIHCDLVSRGIRVNDSYNQTIARVRIDVPPGDQIHYEPQYIKFLEANHLISQEVSNIRLWLTDEAQNLINTQGESWSVEVIVNYIL